MSNNPESLKTTPPIPERTPRSHAKRITAQILAGILAVQGMINHALAQQSSDTLASLPDAAAPRLPEPTATGAPPQPTNQPDASGTEPESRSKAPRRIRVKLPRMKLQVAGEKMEDIQVNKPATDISVEGGETTKLIFELQEHVHPTGRGVTISSNYPFFWVGEGFRRQTADYNPGRQAGDNGRFSRTITFAYSISLDRHWIPNGELTISTLPVSPGNRQSFRFITWPYLVTDEGEDEAETPAPASSPSPDG